MTPKDFLKLAELLPEPALLLAADGTILAANHAARALVGRSRAELVGKPIQSLSTTPADRLRAYLANCLSTSQRVFGAIDFHRNGEQTRTRCEGARLPTDDPAAPAHIFLRCIPRESESRFGVLSRKIQQLNREIAERRQAEALIQKLNAELEERVEHRTRELQHANRELESFAYSVSHDLRAPLRSIAGFSQALEEDYAVHLDDGARDYLERIQQAAQRMGKLIDDLLKLSRIGRAELERREVDLSALADAIAKRLHETDGADRRVEVVIQSGLQANGDPRLLEIALENLFSNAWKFSRREPAARIEFGVLPDRPGLFFVRDNGVGFDMNYADKLFGTFQRLHHMSEFEGTGIGLATVKRILQRHGGNIYAESSPGEGATFYFTLAPQTTLDREGDNGRQQA